MQDLRDGASEEVEERKAPHEAGDPAQPREGPAGGLGSTSRSRASSADMEDGQQDYFDDNSQDATMHLIKPLLRAGADGDASSGWWCAHRGTVALLRHGHLPPASGQHHGFPKLSFTLPFAAHAAFTPS